MNYGAAPEEWQHWSETLGLAEDLLPVVCRRGVTAHPSSKIKDYGKVPSKYIDGRDGPRVVGIPQWTSYYATEHDMREWPQEPDYGICLQTRRIRALDCDLTDKYIALQVRFTIIDFFTRLGVDLPIRARSDSHKFLVLFEVEGEYGKRVMKTKGGAIEFLANGQQCLVAGTHKDGARYQWGTSLPTIPLLNEKQFEELWSILEITYATEEPTISRVNRKRSIGVCISHNDPVVTYLRGLK